MTQEQLSKATEIQKKIDSLLAHKSEVLKRMGPEIKRSILSPLRYDYSKIELRDEFCCVNPQTFLEIYVLNIDLEIGRLEEQFKNI